MNDTHAANLHLLSRNPIFTASRNVWGYEIQATSELASGIPADPERGDVGTAIIAGDYVGLKSILARNKKLLLAYSREQLLALIPHAIPAGSSAILVAPRLQHDREVLPLLERLGAEGHTIALEWDGAVTPASPAFAAASLICLASPGSMSAGFDAAGKTVLVRGVSNRDELDTLQSSGATLFQGRFFKTPEIIPGRRLSSHQNSRLQLLRLIETGEPDLDRLAQTIQADVALSYRLLTYLNSPTFGFLRKVDSIRHAISLLGWTKVRGWLRAVLLADMTHGDVQGELLHLSLWRGRFLEQVVERHDYWDFRPDELFLLGMFSLLDAILAIPMAEALSYLPLTDAQKKALSGEGPTEYAPLLTLMTAFEEIGGPDAARAAQDLGLDPAAVGRMHHEAGAWAASILEAGQGS